MTIQNKITVTYEQISGTFNDKDLYESVKEGDTIEVVWYRGYNREGGLVDEMLLRN